ncbi:zf-CCHC domain-containing protein [Tanacetum coccineum]
MSLKALDEGYSSKNYVRKFLRALHPKWRAKVTAIEESKDLKSLSLDELIGNLKVHEMIIKKDSEIVKAKVERKSLALTRKIYSDDKNGKSDRKCFRCGDPNHLIGECPKPPKDKNQRAFVGGSWSDSGEEDDEKVKNETCLVAQASSEKQTRQLLSHKRDGSENSQTNAIVKLPILKQGEYEMWRLRIEQYFQVQNYALWNVIENENSFKPTARTTANADGTSTLMIPGPVTIEEKAQKNNDVKARSMLLMALPNEHQLTFNQYKDAKTFTNEVNTTNVQVSTTNSHISTADTPDSTANLSDATVYAFLQSTKRVFTCSSRPE